jgi:DNA-3-methyladenine glycosylase II
MFLIFKLGRLDVWPVDDFGVRKGYARLPALADMPVARSWSRTARTAAWRRGTAGAPPTR